MKFLFWVSEGKKGKFFFFFGHNHLPDRKSTIVINQVIWDVTVKTIKCICVNTICVYTVL